MHTPNFAAPIAMVSALCSGEAVPCGYSAAAALKKWGRGTHGDHAIALREVIFAYPLPQVRLLMLLLIGGYFARKIGAVSRVSVRFLTVDSPSRVKYAAGPSTTSYGLDNLQRVVETSASESAVLDRARALSINAIVAAMASVVVELTYDRKRSAKAWCGSLAAGSAFIAKASLAAGA